MKTLQISPAVIRGGATAGQYVAGEGSQSANYCIKWKWVSSWLLYKTQSSCTHLQTWENRSWYFSKCSSTQNSLCLSALAENTPLGRARRAPATPSTCVVPAWKWQKATASQGPVFKPGLGLRLLSCCLRKFLFLLTFLLVNWLLTQKGRQAGLLPFSATGTFEPPFSISPANMNQGSAKTMHYLPSWNWKETGFLEETGIL